MTSQSSFTSSESDASFDKFYKSLNESLTQQYHAYFTSNFVSEVFKSVNSMKYVEDGNLYGNFDSDSDFIKSPQLTEDTDSTEDITENVIDSVKSEKQQDHQSVDMFSMCDGEDAENVEQNGQNILNENSSDNSEDESLLKPSTSISVFTCIAEDTTFCEAFDTWKSSNHETQCMTTAYINQNASSIVSVDTCIADNSTFCDAYENWITTYRQQQSTTRTLIHRSVRPLSSISTGFQVASHGVKRPYMESSSKYGNNIDDDDKTTYCEISEKWISTQSATETEKINFNLEEAYAMCFLENPIENSSSDRRKTLIAEIEKLTLKVLNDLKSGHKMKITVPNKPIWSNCVFEDERLSLKPLEFRTSYVIQDKRKLATMMFVLSFIYKMLLKNITCTKREIYYRDPEFTQSQYNVDIAIRDVCIILNARPWELGILSSSKGLIAGFIKITLHDNKVINVGSIHGGILLPLSTTSIKKVETSAAFVLLVEKDTIYERLLSANVLSRLGKPCILITGKGYPDINTRVILKRIWDDCKCPIYALVDADPYGIEIMLTYRHGSLSMSYNSEELVVPSIRWIGVYPSEIKSLDLPYVSLTGEDVRKINDLIKRPYINTKVYEELLVLKETMRKTEVEALTVDSHDLIDAYLLKKIESGITI